MPHLITNRAGGFALLGKAPFSRYSGVFFMEGNELFKIVEDIKINDSFVRIISNSWIIERVYKTIKQSFFIPLGLNAIVYESTKRADAELILDCRKPYDSREYGRYYDIEENGNKIIITFTKKTDSKEDSSNNNEEFKLFVVLRTDDAAVKKTVEWQKTSYALDRERNSFPYERYVFSALKLNTRKFVVACSKDRDKALYAAEYVFRNVSHLKKIAKAHCASLLPKRAKGLAGRAYKQAVLSLDQLLVKNKGIYAGLPWFFQFWSRDTAVCLKALCIIRRKLFAKKFLFSLLSMLQHDGSIPNRVPPTDIGSADAVGWVFKRAEDLLKKRMLSKAERAVVEKKLAASISGLLKRRTQNTLAVNNAQETWMDTNFNGDSRQGARIEIQSMRLFMYRFMHHLSKKPVYKHLELRLRKKVKELFWNGKVLADGLNDWTIRPNIFIAYYFYPQLLSKEEWKIAFNNSLEHLWLEWGGLATIDKNNPLYHEHCSGELPDSYHHGDSWFWLNNLAALCMHRLDKKLFKPYIGKILEASTEEILEQGIIGSHAELSSASGLKSEGCLSQAWSLAMFIELVQELA